MVQKKTGQLGPRFFIFFTGLIIMSLGVVLLIVADIGVPPWDVLHIGLYLNFGLTIGTWTIIVGLTILALSSLIMKQLPKFGAFLNMLTFGIFVDFYLSLPFIATPPTFIGKVIMFIVGVIIVGYGMGLYISASFGAGPRDSLMIALVTVTGWKVSTIRALIELAVLIIGWILGGPVFVGTILFTIIIGPVSGFVIPQCERFTSFVLQSLKKDNHLKNDKIVERSESV